MILLLLYQSQNTLFGPHDTSRVSESDLQAFSSDGNHGYLCMFSCVNVIRWSPKQKYFIAELPQQRGLLFSDDEQQMELDTSKTKGLIAVAQITLFEVELVLSAHPASGIRAEQQDLT